MLEMFRNGTGHVLSRFTTLLGHRYPEPTTYELNPSRDWEDGKAPDSPPYNAVQFTVPLSRPCRLKRVMPYICNIS